MQKYLMIARFCTTGVLFVILSGCGSSGSPIVAVHGLVKLDGKPVPEAVVQFVPEKGRPSTGITDANGRYDLVYTHDQKGALIGTHKVKITTGREKAVVEGKVVQETVLEKIPMQYNVNSNLTAAVKTSGSAIDFELSSK